jgi:hypothetical protein
MSEADYADYVTEHNQPVAPPKLLSTAQIAHHYAVAIINDDYTGLTDDDEMLLQAWIDSLPCCHYITTANDDEPEFGTCEVSRLLADCIDVNIYEA